MSRCWLQRALKASAPWVLLVLSGCAGSVPVSEGASGSDLKTRLRSSKRFMMSSSEEDLDNRYRSTVTVGESPGLCSGVLIHPALVLTAAHCVCWPNDGRKQIDSTTCAKSAPVTSYVYTQVDDEWRLVSQSRRGSVQPHKKFRARLGPGKQVLEATSDLAVIYLEEAMKNVPLGFELTGAEVTTGSEFIAVGYGLTDQKKGRTDRRFFGRNTVTAQGFANPKDASDTDITFLFERSGAHALEGDSGGPCFREDGQGRWLTGIIAQGDGTATRFTSIYPHLLWLKEHREQAEQLMTAKAGSL